jgi:uncharacterized protein (TIGR00290 family)
MKKEHQQNEKRKTLLSWSSGKDSAWTLHHLKQDPGIELVGLFTAMNEKYDRVSMHATPADMLRRQAGAVGLPLRTIHLPDPCSTKQYNTIMKRFIDQCTSEGITCMAFGDLFLPDIRAYREKQLEGTGIEPLFPLWGIPTRKLAHDMLRAGLVAYVSCVDLSKMPGRFAGQKSSFELLAEYPEDCDPCGENGEIHTVVVDGPMFNEPIPVRIGETVVRDGFAYADIIPVDQEHAP